jgi:GGDEF domain-containing protein
MVNARTVMICAFGVALLGQRLDAQEFSRYRTFDLGANLAAISMSTGVAASDAKTLHERPALLQDLQWSPSRWNTGTVTASTDPVEQMVFSFYNDRLFRIAVDYRHDSTDGMTDADLIEAISAIYGAPMAKSSRAVQRVPSEVEADSGAAVARWGDSEHAIVLHRTSSYGQALRLIVIALPVAALAQKADSQAKRLDEREAPSREIARQKNERAAAEKARVANKKVFLP